MADSHAVSIGPDEESLAGFIWSPTGWDLWRERLPIGSLDYWRLEWHARERASQMIESALGLRTEHGLRMTPLLPIALVDTEPARPEMRLRPVYKATVGRPDALVLSPGDQVRLIDRDDSDLEGLGRSTYEVLSGSLAGGIVLSETGPRFGMVGWVIDMLFVPADHPIVRDRARVSHLMTELRATIQAVGDGRDLPPDLGLSAEAARRLREPIAAFARECEFSTKGQIALAVNADRAVNELVAPVLRLLGFRVELVSRVNEAVERRFRQPIPIVMVVSGLDRNATKAVEDLRVREERSNVGRVLIIAEGTRDMQSLNAGLVDALLGSPFKFDELQGAVARVIHNA